MRLWLVKKGNLATITFAPSKRVARAIGLAKIRKAFPGERPMGRAFVGEWIVPEEDDTL